MLLRRSKRSILTAYIWLQATNGADPSRRLNMLGFCRSVNDLSEVVEDAVLSRGGKIVVNQIELKRCALTPSIVWACQRKSSIAKGRLPCRSLYCQCLSNMTQVFSLDRACLVWLNWWCSCSGIHEILKMTVAIPLLYGVPPQHEYLR